MSSNFDDAVALLISEEGGYVNDPHDPGGETKFGISERSFPTLNIKSLTRDQAIQIYENNYWNRANLDSIPYGIALCVFDASVNSGVRLAVEWLQEEVGGIHIDGKLGPVTADAVNNADQIALITEFQSHRLEYLQSLPHWKWFAKGWKDRVDHVTELAKEATINKANLMPGESQIRSDEEVSDNDDI